ncbi:MAG TPA: nucleotidyltransferase domain-containing protein [Methylomirabilota bacterium]
MDTSAHPTLSPVIARATRDPDVLAVIVFDSRARGDASPRSDLDVCLVLGADPTDDVELARKRLEYLAEADVDLVVFQQLPLAVRSRVLKEGSVVFVRDEPALYALAARTARAFEGFRHIHRQYLEQVARD